MRRVLLSRVERVDRVETFLSFSSPHSLIIYSRSSTEGSDTFTQGKSANQLAHLKSFDNQVSAIHSQGAWA